MTYYLTDDTGGIWGRADNQASYSLLDDFSLSFTDIAQSADGTVFLTTFDGLYRYDVSGTVGSVTRIGSPDVRRINALEITDQGEFLLASALDTGIYSYDIVRDDTVLKFQTAFASAGDIATGLGVIGLAETDESITAYDQVTGDITDFTFPGIGAVLGLAYVSQFDQLIAYAGNRAYEIPDSDDTAIDLGRVLPVASTITGADYGNDLFGARAETSPFFALSNIAPIRDYDGNTFGARNSWELIGEVDVEYDGDVEFIYVNPELGRWATVGPDANGNIDFSDHGFAGDTRVVGVYIDPLVAAGQVAQGSDFDSQQRFENDLRIDNLTVVDAFDFDGDGFQEIYFRVNDGTAYLRALMHADGNIQYANYQSAGQVDDYLTGLGYGEDTISTILVDDSVI